MISTKSIFLLAIGIAILSLFFLLPLNQDWMNRRLKGYWKDFTNQATRMKPEQRKVSRYGNAYVYSKQISNYFLQKNIHERVLVLMPPPKVILRNMDCTSLSPNLLYFIIIQV